MREARFGIEVASVDYREVAIFGGLEAWNGDFGGEGCFELFAERFFVAGESEADWAAKNDALRFEGSDERDEAEIDAAGDILPGGWIGDFFGCFGVIITDSLAGGDVFPFGVLLFIDVFSVTWFKIGVARCDFSVFYDATTDAGRES